MCVSHWLKANVATSVYAQPTNTRGAAVCPVIVHWTGHTAAVVSVSMIHVYIYNIYIIYNILLYVRQPHQTSDMLTIFKMNFFAYLKTLMASKCKKIRVLLQKLAKLWRIMCKRGKKVAGITYFLWLSVALDCSCYFSRIFHINIVYECIVLRCIVENKLTYLLLTSKLLVP